MREQSPLTAYCRVRATFWRRTRLFVPRCNAVPLQSRLIVVGDPKQAIYSFRGADIDTYRAALADFENRPSEFGRIYKLSTNFRSVGPLIEWVNRVFDPAMHGAAFQVPYESLDIRHRPHHEKPGPAVTVLRDPRPADGKPIDSGALEANLVAQEIARAVRDGWQVTEPADGQERQYCKAARFSDIAILYPARTGVPSCLMRWMKPVSPTGRATPDWFSNGQPCWASWPRSP